MAGKTVSIDLPSATAVIDTGKDVFLTASFRLKKPTSWADPSHEIAWIQHPLSTSDAPSPAPALGTLQSKLHISKSRARVTVSGLDFSLVFDTARGLLVSWEAAGVALLERDPATGGAIVPGFWRPPTDNDGPQYLPYWQRFGVHKMTNQLRSIDVSQTDDKVVVSTTTFLTPPLLAWGWKATTKYTISSTGRLTVDVAVDPTGRAPNHIPRVGLNLRLPKALDSVRYLGLGPGEAYPDKSSSQRVGVYSSTIQDLHQHYEVPQEGGNRMAARYVAVTESHGRGLRFTASASESWTDADWRRFSWRASRYADETVQAALHPWDLVKEEATLLRLDARVMGVGTGACGPGVRDDLLVKTEPLKFGFVIERVGF